MRRWHLLVLAFVAAIAATAGYLTSARMNAGAEASLAEMQALTPTGNDLLGQPRPDFRLGRTDGRWATAEDFDGQVVVYNFWATWCKPCREEMPMLSALREELNRRGLEVVGVAIDDVERARGFLEELEIRYPALVGSTDVMSMLVEYGNAEGVLPYSVLVDREGVIRWAHFGVLDESTLRNEIEAHLTKL